MIESGAEDEFDYERLKKVKVETTEVKNQLRELEIKTDQTLTPAQVHAVIESYRDMLKDKSNIDEIRILLNAFVDKIIVDRQNITKLMLTAYSAPVNSSLCRLQRLFLIFIMLNFAS